MVVFFGRRFGTPEENMARGAAWIVLGAKLAGRGISTTETSGELRADGGLFVMLGIRKGWLRRLAVFAVSFGFGISTTLSESSSLGDVLLVIWDEPGILKVGLLGRVLS